MHTTHYLRHKKHKNIFFDYYSVTKFGERKYILKWDAKTLYDEKKSLIDKKEEFNEKEKLMIVSDFYNRFYSSKYNEPKKENSPSVVLPMTL